MTSRGETRALQLVYSAPEIEVGTGWFCGHCAAGVPGGLAPAPQARVCPRCGLGLMLETRADALPLPEQAFLIVDGALRVQALSDRAERLLEMSECEAVDRPIAELLTTADGERGSGAELAGAIVSAATRSDEFAHVRVRPAGIYGVRMRARISACGPPRAALVVLERHPPPLRVLP
jgi:hypothetical protein